MSSIEKYIDKLQKGDRNGKRDPAISLGSSQIELEGRTGSSAHQTGGTVSVDLNQLHELGMLTPDQSTGNLANQYRAIKRILLSNAKDFHSLNYDNSNTLMVTSSLPGEGKSFTSISLAMSIAMERDSTVLLVEADLIKPAVSKYLGINSGYRGLADYLASENESIEDLIIQTDVPKLTVLPAGSPHENTAELISSSNMRNLMRELSGRYPNRIIIFDSSPLLLSSDAVILANLVAQVVFVVEAGVTTQSCVKDAYDLLGKDKPVGLVLNKNKARPGAGGYGYYGTYS